MKTFTLITLTSVLIGVNNLITPEKQISDFSSEISQIISNNIEVFNEPSCDGTKGKTFYSEITSTYDCFNLNDEFIGTLLIFDNNKGYINISKEYIVLDSNYTKGAEIKGNKTREKKMYFDKISYFYNKDEVSVEKTYNGSLDISQHFHHHADVDWNNQKTRTLDYELDYPYETLTDTSSATYRNKMTWSTYQGSPSNCGSIAIANLLWTYKINNVVDLTFGCPSSFHLANLISESVPDQAYYFELFNINDTLLSGTGYYLDYCDITNGIGDTLNYAPLIVLYTFLDALDGHYALVSGKGNSLYQQILWMKFYTSWDVVNTWYYRDTTFNNYLQCKYWIDNQNALFGYVLRNSQNETVLL